MPNLDLPPSAFWANCRATTDFRVGDIFQPKFQMPPGTRVATAGSCFAQNISKYLSQSNLHFIDVEPAPRLMSQDIAARYGYGLFSARFGNIYTIRQLYQLINDATKDRIHDIAIWQKDARFFDALRPSIEPAGFDSKEELIAHRRYHLRRVLQMVAEADVLVFTLGLTECCVHRLSGVTFPSAPGVIAGTLNDPDYGFANLGFDENRADLKKAVELLRRIQPDLRIILTVSPVPLTATFSGQHVLRATTYSKSVLRTVAEEAAAADPLIDYFPSYDIIIGTPYKSQFYDTNLRTVTKDGIATVMSVFFNAYNVAVPVIFPEIAAETTDPADEDTICEEALLESLGPQ